MGSTKSRMVMSNKHVTCKSSDNLVSDINFLVLYIPLGFKGLEQAAMSGHFEPGIEQINSSLLIPFVSSQTHPSLRWGQLSSCTVKDLLT